MLTLLMYVSWTFTGDDVLTLVASLLAFGGVILTVVHSFRNLQSRLDAENTARREEARRERSAITAALLAETSDFRKNHLDVFGSKPHDRAIVKFWDGRFHIYESNTAQIGDLGAHACEAVVHFYDSAMEHLGAIKRYLEMEHEEPYPDESPQERTQRQTKFFSRSVSARIDELNEAARKAEFALTQVKSASG